MECPQKKQNVPSLLERAELWPCPGGRKFGSILTADMQKNFPDTLKTTPQHLSSHHSKDSGN